MGNRARFTIASVVSLAAASVPLLPLTACGDGSDHDKVYPLEGSAPIPKEASPPEKDTSLPEEKPDASCLMLPAPIDVQNVPVDPNNSPIGGVIPDGTYTLTSAVFDDDTKDGGVAFKRAGLMKFAGKDVIWQFDTDPFGMADPKCCAGTWAYNATEIMSLNMTCNGQQALFNEIYDYYPTGVPVDGGTEAGAGQPQIMIHVGALHDIYTKQ